MKVQNLGFNYSLNYQNNLKMQKNNLSAPSFTSNYKDDNREPSAVPYHYMPFGLGGYELMNDYKIDLYNRLLDMEEELYEFLDRAKICFEDIHDSAIPDVISHFMYDTQPKKMTGIYHKTPRENAQIILEKQEFDPDKIVQTKYGPGLYFTDNETQALIYAGDTLMSDFEGNVAYSRGMEKYGRIRDVIERHIREFINLPCYAFTEKTRSEHEVISKFIDKYVREKIVSELGIDAMHTLGADNYFVVFNPNCIKKIY